MSFKYNPISKEQAEESRQYPLLKEGEYKFLVSEAKYKMSKSGNPMIEVTLLIHHEGKEFKVFDYLIASETMEWKTRHFCDTCGLLDKYESGGFDEFVAQKKTGYAYISVEAERPKNDGTGGFWKAKNKVDDYVKAGEGVAKNKSVTGHLSEPNTDYFQDSEIPF